MEEGSEVIVWLTGLQDMTRGGVRDSDALDE